MLPDKKGFGTKNYEMRARSNLTSLSGLLSYINNFLLCCRIFGLLKTSPAKLFTELSK